MDIEKTIHEQLDARLQELSEFDGNSDDYTVAVDGLTKLMDRAIELQKLRADEYDEAENRRLAREKQIDEDNFKRDQLAQEKKSQLVNAIMAGAGIVVSTAVTVWGTIKSLQFEETGSVTTIMGRGFIQKLLPKK